MPTMTITTTVDQAQRIAAAVGRALGLERDATGAEVKEFLINHLRCTVHDYERLAVYRAATPAPLDPA